MSHHRPDRPPLFERLKGRCLECSALAVNGRWCRSCARARNVKRPYGGPGIGG